MKNKKKEKTIKERIERVESVLFQEVLKEIPAKLILPEGGLYINVTCGKCSNPLNSFDPTSETSQFWNLYCPKCGNKTIFNEVQLKEMKPIILERKKYGVKLKEKGNKIEVLENKIENLKKNKNKNEG